MLEPVSDEVTIATKFGWNIDEDSGEWLPGLNSRPDHVRRGREDDDLCTVRDGKAGQYRPLLAMADDDASKLGVLARGREILSICPRASSR